MHRYKCTLLESIKNQPLNFRSQMELHLENNVYDRFYSCKCRYNDQFTDNQFLAMLLGHFELCPTAQKFLLGHEEKWSAAASLAPLLSDVRGGRQTTPTSDCGPGSGTFGDSRQTAAPTPNECSGPLSASMGRGRELHLVGVGENQAGTDLEAGGDCQECCVPPLTDEEEEDEEMPAEQDDEDGGGAEDCHRRSSQAPFAGSLGPLFCPICSLAFRTDTEYNRHLAGHVRPSDKEGREEEDHGPKSGTGPSRSPSPSPYPGDAEDDNCLPMKEAVDNCRMMNKMTPAAAATATAHICPCGIPFGQPDDLRNHMRLCWTANAAAAALPLSRLVHQRQPIIQRQFNPFLTLASGFLRNSVPTSQQQAQPLPQQQHAPVNNNLVLDLSVKGCDEQRQQAQQLQRSGLGKLLICPECKFATDNEASLGSHFESEHRYEGTFPCTCGASYDWLPNFLRHYLTCPVAATDLQEAEQEMPLKPMTNSKSPLALLRMAPPPQPAKQNSPQNMTVQVAKHEQPDGHMFQQTPTKFPAVACTWCGRQFQYHRDLVGHLAACPYRPLLKPGVDNMLIGLPLRAPPPPPPTMVSNGNNPTALTNNNNNNNNNNLSPTHQSDLSRPFKCSHCIKSFKSKALLDQHMHIHYPPKYTCRYCGKKYRWPPVFYHHQRTCKKRPTVAGGVPTSGASPTNQMPPNSQVAGGPGQHQHQHHHNGTITSLPLSLGVYHHSGGTMKVEEAACLVSGSRPPPPPVPQAPSVQSHHGHHHPHHTHHYLACMCGYKLDDFNSYVSHVNSCPLLSQLAVAAAAQAPGGPGGPPLFPPPGSRLAPGPAHFAALGCPQPQAQPPSNGCPPPVSVAPPQSPAALMAAVAAACMANSVANGGSAGGPPGTQHLLLPPQGPPTNSPSPPGGFHRLCSGPTGGQAGGTNLCHQCGKEFSSRLSLKQHIEGKHSAEGKYQCPGCSKRYRWGASYYYHKKSCQAAKDVIPSAHTPTTILGDILVD